MEKELWKGNEAVAEAAIRAGCKYFFDTCTSKVVPRVKEVTCAVYSSPSRFLDLLFFAKTTGA